MAIVPMQKIGLSAMRHDQKPLINQLQRLGVVEITQIDMPSSHYSTYSLEEKIQSYRRKEQFAKEALEVLAEYVPTKGGLLRSLEGRQQTTLDEYEFRVGREPQLREEMEHILYNKRLLQSKQAEINTYENARTQLEPWLALTVPLSYKGSRYIKAWVGSLPGSYTAEEIMQQIVAQNPNFELFWVDVVAVQSDHSYLVAYADKRQAVLLRERLDDLHFQQPAATTSAVPARRYEELSAAIERTQRERQACIDEIKEIAQHIEDFEFLQDYYHIQYEQQIAIQKMLHSKHTFCFSGYVPTKDSAQLKQTLEQNYSCVITLEDVTDEEVPVQLKNSWFSEPIESVVESFSYPKYRDIDPISVMSIFYYLMFGLMFSDAGYGLLLAGACGALLLKFRNMEQPINRTLRMFFWCGVSTMFWGVIFSSYFGDLVNVASRTFTGHEVGIPPVWFTPLDNPMKLLVFCLGIGIIHLITGYIMKAVSAAKSGDYPSILCDAVFPVAFLLGLLPLFLGSSMYAGMAGAPVVFPPLIVQVGVIVSAVCAVGIVVTAGRPSRNLAKRLLKGVYGLYNMVAGWLSDILSYSRLLALGLATGVIGSVVNTLAAMPGSGIIGFIAFVIIVILGHLMNFGINILGAYVHSNRLEYVEFFGKFYDGGGSKFAPLGIHTTYYTIREEL